MRPDPCQPTREARPCVPPPPPEGVVYLDAADEVERAPLDERTPLQVMRDRAERAESERDAAIAQASRATADAERVVGLLAEVYRREHAAEHGGSYERWRASHTCAADVATCAGCALDERVEKALRAAGLGGPGDTEPPPSSQRATNVGADGLDAEEEAEHARHLAGSDHGDTEPGVGPEAGA